MPRGAHRLVVNVFVLLSVLLQEPDLRRPAGAAVDDTAEGAGTDGPPAR
jgi:hypothetical protein